MYEYNRNSCEMLITFITHSYIKDAYNHILTIVYMHKMYAMNLDFYNV